VSPASTSCAEPALDALPEPLTKTGCIGLRGDRQRPSPDALLKAAEKETRGKLKIFLGAAPGVGKTYEMLSAAQAKRRRRRRRRGRRRRDARPQRPRRCSPGLEVVPRRSASTTGRMLEEMDLDAILKRRPALVLVDELAHTNAPGSRHPKRYLDVEELLAPASTSTRPSTSSIIESLNDVVARITRIRVRETVPDHVVHRSRRRGRADRPDAGRPDPPAARGQGLCARDRRSARCATISRRAT
jgi:K+-sensing histidine kinase KdpD